MAPRANIRNIRLLSSEKMVHRTGLSTSISPPKHPLTSYPRGHLPPVTACTARDERINFLPRIESFAPIFGFPVLGFTPTPRLKPRTTQGTPSTLFAPRNTSPGSRTLLPNGQAAPTQKYKCNPSCIVLLFKAVRLICPKFPTVGSAFGSANSG